MNFIDMKYITVRGFRHDGKNPPNRRKSMAQLILQRLVSPGRLGIALFIVPFLIATASVQGVNAQSEVEKGLEIAQKARDADRGFENFIAEMVMILRNKQGQENKRSLRIKVMEVSGDGNMSLFVFDNPRDVKGTALLIHGHLDK